MKSEVSGLLAALGLCGMCCSLIASCRPRYITLDFSAESEGGSESAGSGGSGAGDTGGGGADGEKDGCAPNQVCMLRGEGQGPMLLWLGPKGHAPTTGPMRARAKIIWDRYADLVKPASACKACTCGTLNHTCGLPTSMTAYDTPCPGGQQGQPFDAMPSWDGTCEDSHPIPAPNTVQSLVIGSMSLTESCPPSPATQTPEDAYWTTEAAAFADDWRAACPDHSAICVPTVTGPGDPPEGFRLCMLADDHFDVPCHGEFTEKHIVYRNIVDSRTCDPCTCTPPAVQGTCQSFVTVYQDINSSCNGPEVAMISISSDKSTCIDINPAGQQLGSKSASAPSYIPAPGSAICQPAGGTMHGDVAGGDPTTFCCLPSTL